MQLTLCPVTPDDEPFCEFVYLRSRDAELAPLPWTPEQKRLLLRQQYLAQQRHYQSHFPGVAFWLVLVDRAPVGRLVRWETAAELRLMDLRLLPEWQGRGVGTRLIGDLQEEAASGHRPVTLHVERTSRAVGLYQRLGFRLREQGELDWFMEWPGTGADATSD